MKNLLWTISDLMNIVTFVWLPGFMAIACYLTVVNRFPL